MATDAANDAAGAGVDLESLRGDGGVELNLTRARQVAAEAVAASGNEVQLRGVQLVDADTVAVTVEAPIERIFATAFGVGGDSVMVTVEADADDGSP